MVDKPLLLEVLSGTATINQKFVNCAPLPNGAGGHFSVVCSATHSASGKKVALKFHADQDPYRRACFDREGRLLNSLMGVPMIIQIVEPPDVFLVPLNVVLANGQTHPLKVEVPFLALEWMDDGHVGTLVSPAKTRAEFLKKLSVFREACKAVRHLHARQIYHRDLKPENLMLDQHLSVRVSDLGTARLVAPSEPPLSNAYAAPVGDLRYTSPEFLAGFHQDPSLFEGSDVYSLGLILHELLTGLPLQHFGSSIQDTFLFMNMMERIPVARRRTQYEQFLGQRANRPADLWVANPELPKCAREVINRLVSGLTHFDFRRRLSDWDDIYRLIEIAIRTTENEESYLRMLARRRQTPRRSHDA